MAKIVIKANIIVPQNDGLSDLIVGVTGTSGASNGLSIPFRYAFNTTEIANYDALKTSGFFRATTPIGPDGVTGAGGKYGYQLPRTEKLMLLVTKGATGAESFTISGAANYGVATKTVAVPSGALGDQYTYSLYDFGLHINANGEIFVDPVTPTLNFALIVRD